MNLIDRYSFNSFFSFLIRRKMRQNGCGSGLIDTPTFTGPSYSRLGPGGMRSDNDQTVEPTISDQTVETTISRMEESNVPDVDTR